MNVQDPAVPREKKARSAKEEFRIRRRFPGYGDLNVASGARNATEFKRIDDAVQAVGNAGKYEWLRAIDPRFGTPGEGKKKSALKKPIELLAALNKYGKPERLPDPNVKPFTLETVKAWLARWKVSDDHKDSTRQHLQALCKLTNNVDDLGRVLRDEKIRLEGEGKYNQFHARKKAVIAYLKHEVGRKHPAWDAVQDVAAPGKKAIEGGRRKHHPLTVAQALQLAARLGPGYDQAWMDMCLTGARPTELFRADRGMSLDLKSGHIRIHGEDGAVLKTGAVERIVPRLKLVGPDGRVWKASLQKPAMGLDKFADRLREITDRVMVSRDGRRTYSIWLEYGAELPHPVVQYYMGHAKDMTQLYQEGANEVVNIHDRYADRVNRWLDEQEKQTTTENGLKLQPAWSDPSSDRALAAG